MQKLDSIKSEQLTRPFEVLVILYVRACSLLLSYPTLTLSLHVRMYTEVQAEDVAISLFIKRLSDEDAGLYRCTAVYAGNMNLEASVSVSIFRE